MKEDKNKKVNNKNSNNNKNKKYSSNKSNNYKNSKNYKNNTKKKSNSYKKNNEPKINLEDKPLENKTLDSKKITKESLDLKKKKKLKMKTGVKVFIIIFLLLLIGSVGFIFKDEVVKFFNNLDLIKNNSKIPFKEEKIDYTIYFHDSVKLKEDKTLYKYEDDKFSKIGTVKKDIILNLEDTTTKDKGYFKIKDFDFYIDYKDLEEFEDNEDNEEENSNTEATYMNYIPFNESIRTKEKTNFYLNDTLNFTIDESMEFPIIIKDTNYYGIIYNDKLYYIKKDEVEVFNNSNTNLKYTTGIATLVYHFVYDSNNLEEAKTCKSWNSTICLSDTLFRSHMSYLKESGFYTASMKDISLFIDGKIRLPEKTVLITIDDGSFTAASIKVLEELNMHATIFLIGQNADPNNYKSPSIELHSHSYNMHIPGVCPGGQGAPIKCMEREKILEDLRKSREQLNGTTVFCYPFFEYNDYAISLLKEAGFEMAFIGGRQKIRVGSDKYKLPRYGIISTTNVNDIKKIVN